MSIEGDRILQDLRTVDGLRAEREADPSLGERALALKQYQQRRFARTYADLLSQPRYARAAQFFLDDLYGPRDFAHRDAQFARIVPSLVRLFPGEVVDTVVTLGRLHALSEEMDTRMAKTLQPGVALDAVAYVRAWQVVGERALRERQVALTLEVGHALEAYVRHPVLRATLRMMRRPAQLAGLGALQAFLESGFDAFAAMRGAQDFLATIEGRERALIDALFAADAIASVTVGRKSVAGDALLGQLP